MSGGRRRARYSVGYLPGVVAWPGVQRQLSDLGKLCRAGEIRTPDLLTPRYDEAVRASPNVSG